MKCYDSISETEILLDLYAVLRTPWILDLDIVQNLQLDLGLRSVLLVVFNDLQCYCLQVVFVIEALEHLSEGPLAKDLHKLVTICDVVSFYPRIVVLGPILALLIRYTNVCLDAVLSEVINLIEVEDLLHFEIS